MKNLIIFGVFIFALVLSQFAYAQTAADIIGKHIAAMGGREKIMSLSSVLMTGTFKATGDTSLINLMSTKKHMVGSRIDIEANNTKNYQVVTPQSGWIFTPVQGDKEPRRLADDQFKVGQILLDLHGPFINTSEKGYKVEIAGKDTVDGTMCYNLKVTAPNNNVTIYAIDSKSNFIVKSTTKMFQFGAWEDVVTIYGDYKQNADGFWFAHSNFTPRGNYHYDKIVTNQPIDVTIFNIK